MEDFCELNRCDMGLLLGDNFYPIGVHGPSDFEAKFEKPYARLPFKFYPVLGNHDMWGDWKAQIAYKSSHWDMPGRWYSMSNDLLNVMALDTNPIFFPEEEAIWLRAQLSDSTGAWRVVYGHHPVYSSGEHGDTHTLKEHLKPILEKENVDFYLSGHDHDKELIQHDTGKYVVCGAGSKHRPVKAGRHTQFASSKLGFCYFLLKKESALLQFIGPEGQIEFQKEYVK